MCSADKLLKFLFVRQIATSVILDTHQKASEKSEDSDFQKILIQMSLAIRKLFKIFLHNRFLYFNCFSFFMWTFQSFCNLCKQRLT